MKTIPAKVGSITELAFFNVIGDLDSPKYYEVLSFINAKYKDIKILNICILPEKTRVINPRVDNDILYNVSAIGNFTDSTILIEYDKIIEIVEKEKGEGEVVNTTHITNKIADILSYYMYVMFINKSTRQTHDDILREIPLKTGIATLAYVDDTTDPAEMANKLTTDYLVGFTKSTTIYRRVICDDSFVTSIIDRKAVKTAGVLTYIAPSLPTELPRTNLPPRGLTIVIDTGIKKFFSELKRNLEVKNDDIIKEIYSNVEKSKNMLPRETNIELRISRLIAYYYIVRCYLDYIEIWGVADADSPAAAQKLKAAAANMAASAAAARLYNEFDFALPAESLNTRLTNELANANTIFNFQPDPTVDIFDYLDNFFTTHNLSEVFVIEYAKIAVTTLNKVLPDTINKFILTNNVIYQIIKQNDFSILQNPEAVKDILEISIESGKSLPINSPYLKIVGSLREVEGINKIDLEILRLERLDENAAAGDGDLIDQETAEKDLAAAEEALAAAKEVVKEARARAVRGG